MHLQLFDGRGSLIDSAELRRGIHFRLAGGSLNVRGPLTGFRGGNSNLGTGVEYAGSRVHLTATGGLPGASSSGGAGLVLYAIPAARFDKQWSYWPRLPE